MKNHKQLLADFYLALLARPEPRSKTLNQLILSVSVELAVELDESLETIQRIFERMAAEDAKL